MTLVLARAAFVFVWVWVGVFGYGFAPAHNFELACVGGGDRRRVFAAAESLLCLSSMWLPVSL